MSTKGVGGFVGLFQAQAGGKDRVGALDHLGFFRADFHDRRGIQQVGVLGVGLGHGGFLLRGRR